VILIVEDEWLNGRKCLREQFCSSWGGRHGSRGRPVRERRGALNRCIDSVTLRLQTMIPRSAIMRLGKRP
jgi:hypothetical protein